jgi:anaerobic selenocysteine-containing dehydrogenase
MGEHIASDERVVRTLCRICDAACGVEVHIRDGRIVAVKGDKNHPTSQGALCVKGRSAAEIVHSPDRLTSPLLREGPRGEGGWKEISWDQALEASGPECLAVFRGQAADWGAPWHYAVRFIYALGSPNISTSSHICYFPRLVAEQVTYGGIIAPEYEKADVIVEWGATRAETHLPFWQAIRGATSRGAKLISIDPVKSKVGRVADHWIQIRPGTDGALALGLIHVMLEEGTFDRDFVQDWTLGFERLREVAAQFPVSRVAEITRVPADQIRVLAELIGAQRATAIHAGNGLEHHTNTFQTLRAIACLRALAGTLDAPGGNIFPTIPRWVGLKGADLLSPEQKVKRLGGYDLFSDISSVVPFPVIVDSIMEGEPYPIRGLLVIGGNPAVSMPNTARVREALSKLDFLAVAELFMTQTARLADIVFPAASHYEKCGLLAANMFGESKDYALVKQKALELEGPRPDWWILLELSRRMGSTQGFPWETVEEAIDFQLSPSGLTVEQLSAHPEGIRFRDGEVYQKYEEGGFRTPCGKVEFVSETLRGLGYDPVPNWEEPKESPVSQPDTAREFPLIGCSAGKSVNYMHTQFRNIPTLRGREPEPWVRIHPSDAKQRGIADGAWVRIRSPRGKSRSKAVVTEAVMRGVVSISGCWGETFPEANMNPLIDDRARDPVTASTGSRSFLCEIEPV